jgi:hypothetical protein
MTTTLDTNNEGQLTSSQSRLKKRKMYNDENVVDVPPLGHLPGLWYSQESFLHSSLMTNEKEHIDDEEILGVKEEDNFPSEFQENISNIVDLLIISDNNPKEKPKPTTTTVARPTTNGTKRVGDEELRQKKLHLSPNFLIGSNRKGTKIVNKSYNKKIFSSAKDNTSSITTFLCSKKIQSTSKQPETTCATTSSGINNHTGTALVVVGPNKKRQADKKQQVSNTPRDSSSPDTTCVCSNITSIWCCKVLTLADFPTRKPLLDITNQFMQCNGGVNLPSWVLNESRFKHQLGYDKISCTSNKLDNGNHLACVQNQINHLKAYKNEDYGPLDSFSGCNTLLCQVEDKKELGEDLCGVLSGGVLTWAMSRS